MEEEEELWFVTFSCSSMDVLRYVLVERHMDDVEAAVFWDCAVSRRTRAVPENRLAPNAITDSICTPHNMVIYLDWNGCLLGNAFRCLERILNFVQRPPDTAISPHCNGFTPKVVRGISGHVQVLHEEEIWRCYNGPVNTAVRGTKRHVPVLHEEVIGGATMGP